MQDLALEIKSLSKSYIITARSSSDKHRTFRESLSENIRFASRRLKGPRDSSHSSTFKDTFWALRDFSLNVAVGDRIGIIGRNGAGKSTLLKILSRITEPTSGKVVIRGRVSSLLEVGTGFHSELTGRENIYLSGAILGMSRTEIRRKFEEIVNFSGCEQFIDTPVKRYSSGMYVRLAFSVAAHLESEILIVDEVLAVGDAEFQKKCLTSLQKKSDSGRTVIFVSHNLHAVAQLCTKGVLLDAGQLRFNGSISETIHEYMSLVTNEGGNSFANFSDDENKPVQIRSICICDSRGEPTSVLDWNDDICVKIVLISRGVFFINCALQIANSEGVRLIQTDSANSTRELCLTENDSELIFESRIPGGYLNPGTFVATVIVNSGHAGNFDSQISSTFNVEAISPMITFLGRRKRDLSLIRLPVDWVIAKK